MAIDTDRLVTIAHELKSLDQRREKLLAELGRIAGGIGGGTPPVPRRGRPTGSRPRASAQAAAVVVRRGPGRPPGSRNQPKAVVAPAKPAAPTPGRKPRKGLTTDIMGLLAGGGSYTAGEIVAQLKLPKTRSKSVSPTLVRLRKAGRLKKDKVRGYRAA